MKSEKGKLFGKLNIIDLLVILVIIAAAVFLGMRVMKLGGSSTDGLPKRIRYEVQVLRVDPVLYESIKTRLDSGETQLVAGESFIEGNVVGVRAEPYRTSAFNQETNQNVYVEDPYFLTLFFTVEATVTSPVNQQVVTQEIRVGRGNTVKTLGIEMTGTIFSVETIE